jgi:phage-related minor tail protein
MALQKFFLKPLQDDLAGIGTSLFAARGAVFDATNNVVPLAKGGVVSGPTLFPFADGGKIGLMGEAGPEAVVPLARTSSNELGVKIADAGGGGGPGGSRMTTVNQYITTTDADSFRKSRRQIANDARRGIG